MEVDFGVEGVHDVVLVRRGEDEDGRLGVLHYQVEHVDILRKNKKNLFKKKINACQIHPIHFTSTCVKRQA